MGKVGNINTTSIRDAIRLGCHTIGNVLNVDDNYFPFFGSVVRPDVHLGWGLESDIPGRHLDALLNAEDAAGVPVDEDVVEKEANALLLFAFCNDVVEKIKIPGLKSRIVKLLAEKLDVQMELEL